MAKIEYSKDSRGYYYVDRMVNGKRCLLRSKDAKKLQRKIDNWIAEQARTEEEEDEHGALFTDVAEEWFASKEKTLKHGTIICYKPAKNRAIEYFAGKGMKDITPDDIAQFLGSLALQGKASKTLANQKSVLMMVFNYWRFSPQWKGQKNNPVIGYKLPAGLPKEERQPPSEEAIDLVKQHPEGFGIAAHLFMYTGARLGEINALQWKDIDFDRNKIYINKSVSWHGNIPVVGTPKTKNAVRVIPLLQPLKELLLPMRAAPDIYVLSGGSEPLTEKQYRNRWTTYCHSLGLVTHEQKTWVNQSRWIYKPTVTAHQFRHEFASCLYEIGVGEKEAQALLGHADIATTHKVYTHLRNRQLDAVEEKLNAFFTRT